MTLVQQFLRIFFRKRKYDFDRLLYVVDESQRLHFIKLLLSLHKLDELPLDAARAVSDFHVAFGRIEGMSTRRGDVVFLSDLLRETVERMRESIHATSSKLVFFVLSVMYSLKIFNLFYALVYLTLLVCLKYFTHQKIHFKQISNKLSAQI